MSEATVGELYHYDVEATDPDGDGLGYDLLAAPAGMVIDGATGLITFAPEAAGSFPVSLRVSDGQAGEAFQSYTLEVIQPNCPPEITSTPLVLAFEGEPYRYQVEATDPDNDPLIFSLTTAPAGMDIDAATGLLTWTPQTAGDHPVTVRVEDGRAGSDTQSYTLSVMPSNHPPSITSTPIPTATVDTPYFYDVAAEDPDGDRLTYTLSEAPLGMAIEPATGLITWTPVVSAEHTVQIEVTDTQGASASQRFNVTVGFNTNNRPPVLGPIGALTAALGQTLRVPLAASDPEGNALHFFASPLPLPKGMDLNATTGLLTFRPTLALIGTHTLTLGISDGRFEDTETVTITVPPPGDTTSLRGQVVTLNNAPLAGVRLEMLGVEDRTDANGEFRLADLPQAGAKRLLVDGSTVNPGLGTFATVPEVIEVIGGADNVVEPEIVLLPLDVASADPIDPFVPSTITSRPVVIDGETFAPVTFTVPARTATSEATGALYEGLVHISRIPDPALGPRPLPDDLDLSIYIAMQPFGVQYNPPGPHLVPKRRALPARQDPRHLRLEPRHRGLREAGRR